MKSIPKLKFLTKGYSTVKAKNLAKDIPYSEYTQADKVAWVYEIPDTDDLRIIIVQILTKSGKLKYTMLVTNISSKDMDAVKLFHFYKELILQAKDKRSLKKLEALGAYPGDKFVRRLQGKYNLAAKIDLSLCITAFKNRTFKCSDITAMLNGIKANEKVIDFLGAFDLNSEPAEYKIPIYYILGGNDWQTPYTIAEEYFSRINAPYKNFYLIPNAGHMTMLDQPQLFFEALLEISIYNKNHS